MITKKGNFYGYTNMQDIFIGLSLLRLKKQIYFEVVNQI